MNSLSKKLGDIADIKQGRYLAKEDMAETRTAEHPVPVHGANGIIGWTDRAMYETGVPLVTCRGSNSGMVLWASGPLWVSNNAMAIIPRDGDLRFAYYCLLNAPPYETVSGSAQPQITRTALSPKLVFWPDADEQRAISDALSAFDDKIELNRRMNDTVEGMAQAIFRDWFVGFGPVRRKLAGETDPVAIMGGLTPDPARAAELAALFPAELNDSGLPQGWIERPLDQIAEFLNGLALQKFPAVDGESSLPVIKIAELRNGLTEKSNRASPHLPNKYIVRDGDYLFSWSGSLMAKVWTEGDGALNQHLFKVSSTSYPQWFFGAWVEHHLPEFQQIAASKATTMGHIQRGHLTSAMTVCPPQPTLDVMATVLAPLWDRRIQNDLENRTLAETRDYLLPRLMSGEVRVTPSDTESAAA